jgi:Tfp pilus assembly protein PilE
LVVWYAAYIHHSHTTQATNATIANANRQEAKTKQKRTKKRDQLDFESVEIQLADCKATFSNILFFFIIICDGNVFYH